MEVVTAEFVDAQKNPVALDAPMQMRVAIEKAEIRLAGKEWGKAADFVVSQGDRSTPALEIRPTPYDVDTGMLQATGFLTGNYVVLNDRTDFLIRPPWWLRLLMAIFGGVLLSTYQAAKQFGAGSISAGRTWVRGLVGGIFAGAFAYLLADWDVIGIKIDTTRLRGFIVLGLLMSYVGVEPALARLLGRKEKADAPDNSTVGPEKTGP